MVSTSVQEDTCPLVNDDSVDLQTNHGDLDERRGESDSDNTEAGETIVKSRMYLCWSSLTTKAAKVTCLFRLYVLNVLVVYRVSFGRQSHSIQQMWFWQICSFLVYTVYKAI